MESSRNPSPPSLAQIQRWVRWIVTDPRGVDSALAEPRGRAPELDCLALISGASTRLERLSVYAEGYFSRLLDSLAESFQTVARLLEPEGFARVVADYLEAHPSTHANILEVGDRFPEFLARHPSRGALPFLGDLAALEWSVLVSLLAEDLPAFESGGLSAMDASHWPDVRVKLDSSVILQEANSAIDKLWTSRGESDDDFRLVLESLRPSPTSLLIYRENFIVHVETPATAHFRLLSDLKSGRALGEICERIAGEPGIPSADIQSCFEKWAQQGIIRSYYYW